jgi:transcription elongation factor Elf1
VNDMPMCPFCNRETTYVVPQAGSFHCTSCGGDFDKDGEPIYPYDDLIESDCVMCGKEGAIERSDGKAYCSFCWMVWNS